MKFKTVFILFLILTAVLALFGAIPLGDDLISTHPGTTLRGIQQAVKGMQGTEIYRHPTEDIFIFKWTMHDGPAFTGVNYSLNSSVEWAKRFGFYGSKPNLEGWHKFSDMLVNDGWKKISPADLPAGLKATLGGAGAWWWTWAKLSMGDMIIMVVTPAMFTSPFRVTND